MRSFLKIGTKLYSSTKCRTFLNPVSKSATIMSRMPSSDLSSFRKHFDDADNIVILTGAGVSAESGVPTFRGDGGFWRKYKSTK